MFKKIALSVAAVLVVAPTITFLHTDLESAIEGAFAALSAASQAAAVFQNVPPTSSITAENTRNNTFLEQSSIKNFIERAAGEGPQHRTKRYKGPVWGLETEYC